MIRITDSAAVRIKHLVAADADKGLRVKVVGGGCSGLQYKLDVDATKPGDKVFEHEGAKVFADRKSYLYVHGSVLDYAESLMESGFKVENPNVKAACGCGASFAVG